MITEKCKECGGPVESFRYDMMPPIHEKKCQKCGRIIESWQEEWEERYI